MQEPYRGSDADRECMRRLRAELNHEDIVWLRDNQNLSFELQQIPYTEFEEWTLP